jgi:hypothetical protein
MMRDTCKWQKKKSAAPIKYVVKYEFDGSPHYCAIHIKDGDRLHLETSHGSRAATLNPKSDVHSLTMILLMELGAKLVSINSHSSYRRPLHCVAGPLRVMAAVAGRRMAQPVCPQLRKWPVRSGTYASCQELKWATRVAQPSVAGWSCSVLLCQCMVNKA